MPKSGTEVVRTWTPAREPGEAMTFAKVVDGGNTTDDEAVELFVQHYGSNSRQDAVNQFGEFGGVMWAVKDPAGKILGWVGYFYPDALPNYKKEG